MSEIIKCSKCSESFAIPTFDSFKVKCNCGTVYERSKVSGDIYFEASDTKQASTSTYDKVGNGLTSFLLAAIPITLIICVLMFAGSKLLPDDTEPQSTSSTAVQNNTPIPASSAGTTDVIIYSGSCTNFKKEITGNHIKYTEVSKAFGKVVIDQSTRKFSFYYDNKLIYSGENYLSYVDGQQGGEGFTLSDGYSAHSLPAEREFYIYYSPTTGEVGNEYRIKDYKVD